MPELGAAEGHALRITEGLHCSCDVLKNLWVYRVHCLIQPEVTLSVNCCLVCLAVDMVLQTKCSITCCLGQISVQRKHRRSEQVLLLMMMHGR